MHPSAGAEMAQQENGRVKVYRNRCKADQALTWAYSNGGRGGSSSGSLSLQAARSAAARQLHHLEWGIKRGSLIHHLRLHEAGIQYVHLRHNARLLHTSVERMRALTCITCRSRHQSIDQALSSTCRQAMGKT